MTPSNACPDPNDLLSSLIGLLPNDFNESVSAHLETCTDCLATVANATGKDPLASALLQQNSLRSLTSDDRRYIQEIIARARQASPESQLSDLSTVVTEPGSAEVGRTQVKQSDIPTERIFSFLSPAIQQGELGILGKYRILRLLGMGGMGLVFEALDPDLNRRVALKVMKPEWARDELSCKRYLREAQLAAAIEHDNIITIYEVNWVNSVPFLAMQLLKGQSLQERLSRGDLPLDECLRIGREIAQALAAAHSRQLIHRDVKPGNIWLEEGSGRAKLLDFGLARPLVDDVQLTSVGALMGTPAYMSPEQANGDAADARADLFSLGVVLYRMTTGRPPFPGQKTMEILNSLLQVTPPSARMLNPAVPASLSELIDQLLTKNRDHRPADAGDIVQRLARCEAELRSASKLLPAHAAQGSTTRSLPMGWAAFAGAALLLAVVIVTVRSRDGKVTEHTITVPGEVESAQIKILPDPLGKDATAPVSLTIASPLDALDPAAIPATEKFAWQPKDLVGVLGSSRQRLRSSGFSVALSADGAVVAAASDQGLLLDGATAHSVPAPDNFRARSVAISPDGGMIFTQHSLNLFVRAGTGWDTKPIPFILPEVDNPQRDAHFSADGRWLVMSGVREIVDGHRRFATFICDVSVDPPQLLAELPGLINPSLSGDSQRLAVTDTRDKSLQIFNVSSLPPKLHMKLPGVEMSSDFVHVWPRHGFLGDGTLAVVDKTSHLTVWDINGTEPRRIAERDMSKEGYYFLRPFRTGRPRILLHKQDGIRTLQVENGSIRPESTVASSTTGYWANDNLFDAAISQDGRTIATTHLNGMVKLYDAKDRDIRERNPIRQQPIQGALGVRQFCLAPTGQYLATNGEGGTQVWQFGGPAALSVPLPVTEASRPQGALAFINDRQFLAPSNDSLQLFQIEANRVSTLATLRDEPTVMWAANQQGLMLARKPASLTDLLLLKMENMVARRVCEWPVAPEGRRVLYEGPSPSRLCAIHPRGHILITLDAGPNTPTVARVWRRSDDTMPPVQAATIEIPPADGPINSIALAADGEHLAVASTHNLRLWSLKNDRPTHLWSKPGIWYAIAFGADNQQIAASQYDGAAYYLKLFNEAGETLQQYPFHPVPIDLEFAPDRRHLLIALNTGTIFVLRLNSL